MVLTTIYIPLKLQSVTTLTELHIMQYTTRVVSWESKRLSTCCLYYCHYRCLSFHRVCAVSEQGFNLVRWVYRATFVAVDGETSIHNVPFYLYGTLIARHSSVRPSVCCYVYIIFHLVVYNNLFMNWPGHPTGTFRLLTAQVLRGILGLDVEQVLGEWIKLRKEKLRVARSFTLNSLKFADTVKGSQNRGNCKN